MPGRRDEGFFSARDNTRLYWQSLMPEGDFQDVIGLVHGYGDHSGRYKRVTEALVQDGHAVLAFDYRGHGRADGRRGHVSDWNEFLDDITVFWARLRQLASGKPTFLLAHSHGALIATHFAAKKPEGLKGLVMTSPYYKVAAHVPALKVLGAKMVGIFVPWMPVPMGLTPQMLSRDVEWQKETDADALYGKNATPRWFTSHLLAQEELQGLGSQITVPVLMLTAGADPIVSTPAAKGFFETIASSDKTYKEYPGMLHEVMCETGKEEVWGDISRWISAHR
jgi:lysophospholipase